jgi:hypothetical protein
MDPTLPKDGNADIAKGMQDISISSSTLSSAGGSESVATVVPQVPEVKKKEPTAVVDINGLTDGRRQKDKMLIENINSGAHSLSLA